VTAGDVLVLADEPDNPVNPEAMLICARTDRKVGWVPNYLVCTIHELRDYSEADVGIAAEHVNPSTAPPHIRRQWPVASTSATGGFCAGQVVDGLQS